MNTKATRKLVEQNGVVTLKAKKDEGPIDEIHKLMEELGNNSHGIPFLVIYPADGGEPITFSGPLREQTVLDALEKAGPSRPATGAAATARSADPSSERASF